MKFVIKTRKYNYVRRLVQKNFITVKCDLKRCFLGIMFIKRKR